MESNIQVTLNDTHVPRAFAHNGATHRVKDVQESWRLTGAWWDGEGERTFFRVQTDKGGIYDISYDQARSQWRMAVVQD